MIVAKFGGTSVSSKERVLNLCNIVALELKRNPIVVVSALSGVTDLLLSLPDSSKSLQEKTLREIRKKHKRLILDVLNKNLQKEAKNFINLKLKDVTELSKEKNSSKQFLDKLISFGEIMSSFVITKALETHGIQAAQVIATDLIVTNNNFGSAEFLPEPSKRKIKKVLSPLLKNKIVPVVTGFIGSTKSGFVTTLGRGGSDYTASILGFYVGAEEIQIWTDVDGIFTSDPRIVENAKPLPSVSFQEASELAAFGARVLHPRTIRPAIKAGIPVKVLNTFNPKNEGTLITEKSGIQGRVKAVSFKKKIILVNLYSTEMLLQKGFLAKIFRIFANNNISIDLVSVSEVSVSVTLDNDGEHVEKVVSELSEFAKVDVSRNFGMVSLIGEAITSSSKTIKEVFNILDREKILVRMISLGATNINISLVIESEKIDKAVKLLHDRLTI